jgi:hypothetical protein
MMLFGKLLVTTMDWESTCQDFTISRNMIVLAKAIVVALLSAARLIQAIPYSGFRIAPD